MAVERALDEGITKKQDAALNSGIVLAPGDAVLDSSVLGTEPVLCRVDGRERLWADGKPINPVALRGRRMVNIGTARFQP